MFKKVIILNILCLFVVHEAVSKALSINTIYGETQISEPLLLDLFGSKALDRLRFIHQYGVDNYIHKTLPYSRYTHSVGVFYLLRRFGADMHEQVAGLLHDASHTVFSHVGDHVRAHMQKRSLNQNEEALQDDIHSWYLSQTDVAPILLKHNLSINQIHHKSGNFRMLERALPDISADRLEYVLYGGYIEGWLCEQEIKEIVQALRYENEEWYFIDLVQARKFAEISIRLCDEIFAAPWNIAAYNDAAQALLHAVKIGIIGIKDIHFGVDDAIWQKLCSSQNELIAAAVKTIKEAKQIYVAADENNFDLKYTAKFRGINPFVLYKKELVRLTGLDSVFNDRFKKARNSITKTRYLKSTV